MTARRFPPPWSVEEQAACFVVRDHKRQRGRIVRAIATSRRKPCAMPPMAKPPQIIPIIPSVIA